jgi:uncharacterized protein (TIGR02145 family)
MVASVRSLFFLSTGIYVLIMPSCNYEADNEEDAVHKLEFPNNGETLVQGNSYQIRWKDDVSNTMRIRLLRSGITCSVISDQAPSTGEYVWTIPDTLEVDDDYTVKILSNSDDFVYYESEKTFKILRQSDTSSFTDLRDGQVYKTVKLGDRWWMAENFNYDTTGSWCYPGTDVICRTNGRYYSIGAAKNCAPPGWHLPTDDEWQTLEAWLGIPLKSINTTGPRGINARDLLISETGIGFNAKYAGYLNTRNYQPYSLNHSAYFWTSSFELNDMQYWVRQMTSHSGGIERSKLTVSYYALSVRYIRDRE